jgi:hypothetical protein
MGIAAPERQSECISKSIATQGKLDAFSRQPFRFTLQQGLGVGAAREALRSGSPMPFGHSIDYCEQ